MHLALLTLEAFQHIHDTYLLILPAFQLFIEEVPNLTSGIAELLLMFF